MHDVFMSYAREDRPTVERYEAFLRDAGIDVWFDARIAVGDAFEQIANALRDSSFLFLFWSANAAGSTFVHNEVVVAESLGKIIIPIKLDNSTVPVRIRLLIASAQWLDGRAGRFPEQDLTLFASRIEPQLASAAHVIACLNMKGGVGKTTLSANLALALHDEFNKSVLLVDLDPQANLSNLLVDKERYEERVGFDQSIISAFEPGMATGASSPTTNLRSIEAIVGAPPEATQLAFNLFNPLKGPRLDLVLGQFELFKYSLPANFPMLGAVRQYFARFMAQARTQYEIILFDAAPSNSFITECAVAFGQHILAPVMPDKYALRGLSALYRLTNEAFGLAAPPRIHVLRNAVDREPSDSETPIVTAYAADLLDARIPRSDFFAIRNPNADQRVRDPLGELAFRRGHGRVRDALKLACRQLLERIEGAPPNPTRQSHS